MHHYFITSKLYARNLVYLHIYLCISNVRVEMALGKLMHQVSTQMGDQFQPRKSTHPAVSRWVGVRCNEYW